MKTSTRTKGTGEYKHKRYVRFPPDHSWGFPFKPGIGDVLFCEPALRHLAQVTGHPVTLSISGNADAEDFIRESPYVEVVSLEESEYDKSLWHDINIGNCNLYSLSNQRHACDGYYVGVGIHPDYFPKEERRPRVYGALAEDAVFSGDYVTMAPFSRSCSKNMGLPYASKQPNLGLFEEIAAKCPLPVICLSHEGVEDVKNTWHIKGLPLMDAARIVRSSRLLISVATGMMVVAGAMGCNIAYFASAEEPWWNSPQTDGKCLPFWNKEPAFDPEVSSVAINRFLEDILTEEKSCL